MELIGNQTRNDCGLAAITNLLRFSYHIDADYWEVRYLFNSLNMRDCGVKRGTRSSELVKVLESLGICCKYTQYSRARKQGTISIPKNGILLLSQWNTSIRHWIAVSNSTLSESLKDRTVKAIIEVV